MDTENVTTASNNTARITGFRIHIAMTYREWLIERWVQALYALKEPS